MRIGEWSVDPATHRIARDGQTVTLEARTMRLLVCLAEHSRTLRALSVTGSFAVNFLAAGGEGLARRFSTLDAGRFSGVRYANDHPLHAPVLDDAAAWARCRVHRRVEAGDHAIVIGEVAAVDVIDPPALLYVNRGYVRWRSESCSAELAGSA